MNAEETVVHKQLGAVLEADKFISFGKLVIDGEETLESMMQRFTAGDRSDEFLQKYIWRLKKARSKEQEEYFKGKTESQLLSKEHFQLILATSKKIDDERLQHVTDKLFPACS